MSYNIKYYNQLNDIVDNTPQIDINPSLYNRPVNDPQTIVAIILRGLKKSIKTFFSGLTFLWYIVESFRIIKRKHIKPYKSKSIYDKVKYITSTVSYYTAHDAKVHVSMLEFISENLIQTTSILITSKAI